MKRAITIVFLLIILSIVFTATAIRLPTPEYKEYTIEKGQRGEAALMPYTRTYIKLYETSRLDFSIFNPKTEQPIIHNSIIINKVNSDGSLDVQLGLEGKDYELTKIYPGDSKQIQLNFTTKDVPFMFLSESKYKFIQGATDNYAVLYLNVPMFNIITDPNKPQPGAIDTGKTTGGEIKTNYIPYLLIIGVGILIIAIILYSRKNKKGLSSENEEEHKTEEKPKKTSKKKKSKK